jgi:hypothetical protein
MSWYVTAGGEPMGPLPEKQVIAMLRAGVRLDAVARHIDKHWWDPAAYPPFADAMSTAAEVPSDMPVELGPRVQRSFGKVVAALCGSAALLAGVAWWRGGVGGPAPELQGAESTPTEIHDVTRVELGAPTRSADCDVERLWFRGEGLTPAERRANVILAVENWTTDCRWRAMDGICQNGCDGLLSEVLLNASPKSERTALTRLRAEKNHDVALRSRAIYVDVAQLGNDVVGDPAPRAGRKSGHAKGDPASANAGVADPSCAELGPGEGARADELRQKLDDPPAIAVGGFWMKEALRAVKSCIDCAGDRTQCGEVARFLKNADDDIKEYEKGGELGRKTVAARAR